MKKIGILGLRAWTWAQKKLGRAFQNQAQAFLSLAFLVEPNIQLGPLSPSQGSFHLYPDSYEESH